MASLTTEIKRSDALASHDLWLLTLGGSFISRIAPKSFDAGDNYLNAASARVNRQFEFAAGRRCAESLLKRLGNTEQVWTNADRSPAWPQGFTGSISHSKTWTWAAIAESNQLKSIGIDTEEVVMQETREQILFEVMTPAEWKICEQANLTANQIFTLVFSAKEAFFKCCYPHVQQYFGFEHATVESICSDSIQIKTHPSHPCFSQMPSSLEVFYLTTQDDVFTVTWMEQQ